MAITYFEDGKKKVRKGNKIAKNIDPGNFYRRKAKMDAVNDMSGDDFAPKDGKKILDRLLNKKNKKKGQVKWHTRKDQSVAASMEARNADG